MSVSNASESGRAWPLALKWGGLSAVHAALILQSLHALWPQAWLWQPTWLGIAAWSILSGAVTTGLLWWPTRHHKAAFSLFESFLLLNASVLLVLSLLPAVPGF